MIEYRCSVCKRKYQYKNRKDGRNGNTTRVCSACLSKIKRKKQKLKIVEYFGDTCYICGIKGHQSIFDVHHIKNKKFSISRSIKKWENLKKELMKCVLLCANCHAELHFGLFELVQVAGVEPASVAYKATG